MFEVVARATTDGLTAKKVEIPVFPGFRFIFDMFMLKSLFGKIFGKKLYINSFDIAQIPVGQLYLVRPRSPKGRRECIYKDAAANIKRTMTEYHYQLVIQRAYDEGEEQILNEDEQEDGMVNFLELMDEKSFLLDESLKFHSFMRENSVVYAWSDLSGDEQDLYEFVCDSTIQSNILQAFEEVALRCMFERKYRRSHEEATNEDLSQFLTPKSTFSSFRNPTLVQSPLISLKVKDEQEICHKEKVEEVVEDSTKIIVQVSAELHLFDAADNVFILQDSNVVATVSEIDTWEYWLEIKGSERTWLGQPIHPDINPVFNYEYLSFIWNYCDSRSQIYSWLLRFSDAEVEEKFQEGFMIALWEMLNQQKWIKIKDDEKEYIIDVFQQDVNMEDVNNDDPEEDEEEDIDSKSDLSFYENISFKLIIYIADNVSEDEENSFSSMREDSKGENSQLAVGYKHDRSFVVRGNKIGVFRHMDDDRLEFVATIDKVQTPKGKPFQPSKIMLHNEDSEIILQNPNEPHNLYQMDLEYGKVVDEWKIDDNISVSNFTPETKFAQMTREKTLIGISHNSLFRIDPRLPKDKIVKSEHKQYATKNEFTVAATTEKGFIAVASNKGDIRLFDRIGVNAKTALPALGEPIIGIDISADGKWILATCRSYILLVDCTIKEGKNQGKLGFEKSFDKDTKPKPKRLQLNPVHVAMMQGQINFTPAKFNTGMGVEEKTIVTSSGPYVISWELSKVVKGETGKYKIRQYMDEVKANNFKFGTDQNVIVALPHDVSMVNKYTFKKPSRKSLLRTPMKDLQSRSSIVNSPY
ncbi:hypothetical protein T552_00213 [Pneumocystis carinii B80]|uniref:Vacuolar import and degradation protein 27 n=1 Tax=Pneumocystis carinii (strain B80) TaxID=1408658 RepID=A0A0W4ZT75_PNEC8|nr:hypothetical protein T552_00213 [Pneumocystis carinii B80]KTW31575.1 hypothetical protein T552_00213 [Pneumocystis carinii B80]